MMDRNIYVGTKAKLHHNLGFLKSNYRCIKYIQLKHFKAHYAYKLKYNFPSVYGNVAI